MVNKRLKRKPYTSPAVEVLWMHGNAQLMSASVTGSADGQEGNGGYGNNPVPEDGKRFDFANIYDIDGISDGLELEFDIHYSTGF